MIKPYHELTREEYAALIDKGYTYGQLEKDYPQPEWCAYEEATRGEMGCWSLISFMVTGEDFCKKCECYMKKESR